MFDPYSEAFPTEWLAVRESDDGCGSCGADLFPSTTFVWHYPDEDCRGIKQPVTESEVVCLICGGDEHNSNCDTLDPLDEEE